MGSYPIMGGTPCKVWHVRLSEDEAIRLREKCAKLHMSKSEFARLCISLPLELSDARSTPTDSHVIGVDRETLHKIHTELRRWGNNFNQGTRSLNAIGLKYNSAISSEKQGTAVLQNSARAMELMNKAYEGVQEIKALVDALADKACVPIPED